MNEEKNIIQTVHNLLPAGEARKTRCFESDAELIEYNGRQFLFTMDEFSGEDMFRDENPEVLGWNVAAGAVMDIYATGGKPLFYGHSMVVGENWDTAYIQKFSKGIAGVLEQTGMVFIGGDTGKSKRWRYTATVIGEIADRLILRKGAKPGDRIYLTGKIGTGNLEAAIQLNTENSRLKRLAAGLKNRFQLPLAHLPVVNRYATSCIDTSDGVFNALNSIAELNNVGYNISDLPFIKTGHLAAKLLRLPEILLFLGECGEYELLLTIRQENEETFLSEAQKDNIQFYRLGELTEETKRLVQADKNEYDFTSLNISARDFPEVKLYLKSLQEWLKGFSK